MADQAYTLPAHRINKPFTGANPTKFTTYEIIWNDVPWTDTGSTDTVTIKLQDTPAEWAVLSAFQHTRTVFDGAATQVLNLIVGTDGDPDNFIAAIDLFLAAGPDLPAKNAGVATLAGSFGTASDVLRATLTNSVAGSPSAVTQGHVIIYLELMDLTQYPTTAIYRS